MQEGHPELLAQLWRLLPEMSLLVLNAPSLGPLISLDLRDSSHNLQPCPVLGTLLFSVLSHRSEAGSSGPSGVVCPTSAFLYWLCVKRIAFPLRCLAGRRKHPCLPLHPCLALHPPPPLVLTHGNASSPLMALVLPWPFDFQSSDDSDSLFLLLTPLRLAAVLQYSHCCLLVSSLCLVTGKNIVIKGNGSKYCWLRFPLKSPCGAAPS